MASDKDTVQEKGAKEKEAGTKDTVQEKEAKEKEAGTKDTVRAANTRARDRLEAREDDTVRAKEAREEDTVREKEAREEDTVRAKEAREEDTVREKDHQATAIYQERRQGCHSSAQLEATLRMAVGLLDRQCLVNTHSQMACRRWPRPRPRQ